MKNFLSRFEAGSLRKALIYFIISVLLIVISIVGEGKGRDWLIIIFSFGFFLFFYSVLRPWENAKYYGIMGIVFILLIVLGWFVGIDILDILVKMHILQQYTEDMAWSQVFVWIAGVLAGIIGMARWRKWD
jgi:hypothetical protein